jgi:pimeloyl-ACP methyl ester carboxylesterase
MSESITLGGLTLDASRPTTTSLKRPPILFIPGYFAGAWVFEHYLEFFASRGHPSYALNLRGRGGSPLPSGAKLGETSIGDFVADASEVARSLERPIVVGHSMGGLIAQKLAERDEVRAAVLIAPAPPRGISLLTPRMALKQLRYLPAVLRSREVSPRWKDFRDVVLSAVPASEQRGIFERVVPDSGRAGREMNFGRVRVDESKVSCPVFVVAADDDRFIPRRAVEQVAAKYRAPLYLARGHGHFLVAEPGWESVAAGIADWIERHVATT